MWHVVIGLINFLPPSIVKLGFPIKFKLWVALTT